LPPQIQYRLASLSPKSKGLVVWLIEGRYLSRQEMEILSQLPDKNAKVKVVLEAASGREVSWLPLKQFVAAAA
jgi:NAD(P)H-quinone oxidoreductase subunit N